MAKDSSAAAELTVPDTLSVRVARVWSASVISTMAWRSSYRSLAQRWPWLG